MPRKVKKFKFSRTMKLRRSNYEFYLSWISKKTSVNYALCDTDAIAFGFPDKEYFQTRVRITVEEI